VKIELMVLVTIISICSSIYFGLASFRRNQKSDDKEEVATSTSTLVKLENIGNGVNEIKSEMKSIREESRENRDRLIKNEESTKQAHRRLDKIEGER
jgi:hypothetical protein